jgi:tetratricopeptide (TPR) repeat protein
MGRKLSLSLSILVLVGCGKAATPAATTTSTPTATATASATATAAAADDSPLARAKRLALDKPKGEGHVERAILDAQRAVDKNPRKVDGWIVLGRAWVRKARESADPGFYVNADACVDVALDLEPESRLALNLRGLVYLNDHRFAEARDLAQRLVDKDPDDPMAYGTLSDALLELGRYDDAMKAVQKMVDLKPNLPSYARASYLQWLRGDAKAARESARLAIDSGRDKRDPEPEAWTLVQTAMLFWHAGDYDGAEAGFDRALEWMTEYPPALVGKGRVALARGDAKRAAELFGRAFKQSPLAETAWLLGDARALAGDAVGAEEAYALVQKEGAADPRTLSLFLSTKGKDPARALALAEKEKKVRGDVYTDDAHAWALHRAGRTAEARTTIERARRFGTKDARLLFHHGAILMATGDKTDRAKGQKLVREALELNPKFDVAAALEARKLIEG